MPMHSEESYDLWCLIHGDSESTPFVISCAPNTVFDKLKVLAHKRGEHRALRNVDAADLKFWKLREEIPVKPSETLVTRILSLGNDLTGFADKLDPADRVSAVFGEPDPESFHIIIQVPSGVPGISPSPSIVQALESADIQAHITIEAIEKGEFGTQEGLDLNDVWELGGPEPEFLTTFRNKLQQRRWVRPETNTLDIKQVVEDFDRFFEEKGMETDDDQNQDRWASTKVLWHLQGAFRNSGWTICHDQVVKESLMEFDFHQLAGFFNLFAHAKHGIRTNWPLKLLVHVQSDGKNYRYTPKSDFNLSVNGLPFLITEVQSEHKQGDRYRMLLQAACLARLGNALDPRGENPFIVTALYIRNSGHLEQYFVFLPDPSGSKVFYVKKVRYLFEQIQLFEVMFEMYNLASVVRNDRSRFEAAGSRIPKLRTEVEITFKDTFTSTKRTPNGSNDNGTGSNKRARTNHGNQVGTQHGEHVYDNDEVAEAFAEAGYTWEPNGEDDCGLAPLNQLRPTMRHAVHPNSTAVVVKLTPACSDEPSILQYLDSIKCTYNHTIPLLAIIELGVGTFVVLPEYTPLILGFTLGHLHGKVVDLSQQLVDGVAFLHENGVAHLDIKPANMVIARKSHLFIIDFGISVRVNGSDELIDRWLGTPQWMAPEIGDEHGARRQYSPIRADLWSCGLMLQYLASKRGEEKDMFEDLAKQLLNKQPHLRPMLSLSSSVKAMHSQLGRATHLSSLDKATDVLTHQPCRWKQSQGAVHKITGKVMPALSGIDRLKRKWDVYRKDCVDVTRGKCRLCRP